jgi:putative two-component system response regulator
MDSSKTVLIVDDTELNIEILIELLDEKYDILVATDGQTALDIAQEEQIDLILLDIMMPEMDGFEVCRRLKDDQKTQDIPIIFITAKVDEDSIEEAYTIGGVDYITKPFKSREVISRISTHLALAEQTATLGHMVDEKTQELQDLNKEIEDTQKEIIFTMGSIGESRSKETGNHVKRVAEYTKMLALYYGLDPKIAQMLKDASPMHDIGKVGIPDTILNKPGRFTDEEREIMMSHAQLGKDLLSGSTRPLLKMAVIVAFEHHERWDGKGYPRGLAGEDIHIYGRITALADVFDALGSDRCYKKAWDDEKIFNMFKEERGKQFDPKLVDLFFENLDSFLEVRDQLKDVIE